MVDECLTDELCKVDDVCGVGKKCVDVWPCVLDEVCFVVKVLLAVEEGLWELDKLFVVVGAPFVKPVPNSRRNKCSICIIVLVMKLHGCFW